MHDDYHSVRDEADRLSYSRLAEVVRLSADTVALAAELIPSPASTVYVDWLGLTMVVGGEQGSTTAEAKARVTVVEQRAAAAGLQRADELLEIAGKRPSSGRELRRIFDAVRPGQSLVLEVLRQGQKLQLRVQRPYAGYLGVQVAGVDEQWRLRNALQAKSGVLIRQVLDDGPAKQAGLEQGDVLLEIDGTAVGVENLQGLLMRLGVDVEVKLTVLREGKRLLIPVMLGRRP
jgi:S1-C subfamily serine protease